MVVKDYILDFKIWENKNQQMNFKEILLRAPCELVEITMSLKNVAQNPRWHPEGNTLKHVITVFKRAVEHHPNNLDLAVAAFFHDLGKLETYEISPKTGQPTAHGHEKVSAKLVEKYSEWIRELGADPEVVHYIVINHMKMKPNVWDVMKDKKKDKIKSFRAFGDLEKFSKIDRGGLDV